MGAFRWPLQWPFSKGSSKTLPPPPFWPLLGQLQTGDAKGLSFGFREWAVITHPRCCWPGSPSLTYPGSSLSRFGSHMSEAAHVDMSVLCFLSLLPSSWGQKQRLTAVFVLLLRFRLHGHIWPEEEGRGATQAEAGWEHSVTLSQGSVSVLSPGKGEA